MPPKFRELSSLRYNELTQTRTRKRAQRGRGAATQTRDVDVASSSSESDAAPDVSGCSSPKEADAAVAGQKPQRAVQTLDDSPSNNILQREEHQPRSGGQSEHANMLSRGIRTRQREVGDTALISSGAPKKRKQREHHERSPPSAVHRPTDVSRIPHANAQRFQNLPHDEERGGFQSASGDSHINADRRVLHSAASREAGPSFRGTQPQDDVQPRHVSPPQEARRQTRARYGNPAPVHDRSGGALDPEISLASGKQPASAAQGKALVEHTALWVASGSMWLLYNGSYVQVVADAVVDALRHPYTSQLVKHRDIPVMMLSSAAETASAVRSSLRCACLEVEGKFEFHQEQLGGGEFQHIVPVVMLQACRPGIPGASDLILEDIDTRLPAAPSQIHELNAGPRSAAIKCASSQDDPLQCMHAQKLPVSDSQALQDLNQQEVLEAHIHRTPPTLLHRHKGVFESPAKSNEPVVAHTISQPVLPNVWARFGQGNNHRAYSPITATNQGKVPDRHAKTLLAALAQQFPNLMNILARPEGQHIMDMWYGSVAMQEYGAPALFVLAAAITGYPVEFFRSRCQTWPSNSFTAT